MSTGYLRWLGLLLPLLAHSVVSAQPTSNLLPPIETPSRGAVLGQPIEVGKEKIKAPEKITQPPAKVLTDPPVTDIFAEPPAPVSQQLGFTPQMLGDFYGTFARVNVNVVGTQTIKTTTTIQGSPPTTVTTSRTNNVFRQDTVLVPLVNYGAFKVAENASPRPLDRVFFSYNFYSSIRADQADVPPSVSASTRTIQQGTQVRIVTENKVVFPAQTVPFVNLHREVFGFEKTFLNGQASVEVRLPLFQQTSGRDDFCADQLGDLTVIGKYAFYLNRQTGDVLSGGLAVTAPTSSSILTIDGQLHSTLLQPWIGYIWNADRFYMHAFHSAVLPSDSRDVTLLFNDAGVGYWLIRGGQNRAIRFVIPTFEAHLTTPLTNRDPLAATYAPDLLVLTGGVHVGLFRNSILSFGVGAPVTGPRIYDLEAFVQFNRRF